MLHMQVGCTVLSTHKGWSPQMTSGIRLFLLPCQSRQINYWDLVSHPMEWIPTRWLPVKNSKLATDALIEISRAAQRTGSTIAGATKHHCSLISCKFGQLAPLIKRSDKVVALKGTIRTLISKSYCPKLPKSLCSRSFRSSLFIYRELVFCGILGTA